MHYFTQAASEVGTPNKKLMCSCEHDDLSQKIVQEADMPIYVNFHVD